MPGHGRSCALGGDTLHGQDEPERAATAQAAPHPDLAPLRPDQAAGDGQAQPRAAEIVGDPLMGLGEALEDALLGLRRDADPRVRHFQPQQDASRLFLHVQGQDHPALAGELHRVAGQVQQHLAQAAPVAAQQAGAARRDVEAEAEVLLQRLGGDQPRRVAQHCHRIEDHLLEGDAARIQARQVQQVVDQRDQGARGGLDRPRHLPLLGLQRRAAQQVVHADDGGDRRTQLVADAGQEEALRLAGLFRLVPRQGQLADQHRGIARQDHQPSQQAQRQRVVGLPVGRDMDDGAEGQDGQARRDAQISDAEAEAVAEDHPEIERIERGHIDTAGEQPAREGAQIQHDPRQASQDGGAGAEHQMPAEQQCRDGKGGAEPPRLFQRGIGGHHQEEVHQRAKGDRHPVQGDLVLLVGTAAKPGNDPSQR
ncbi:hypothetical protein ROTAS13_03128 [Roseomonas sp. TAS13]|nr:hypothetical protein ROTAS13_03128 [Roseomonas sp. TAS13]